VYLRLNPDVSEGALGIRQRHGDAECDGLLRIIRRRMVETEYVGATAPQLNGHAERNREGSIAGLGSL